MNCEKTRELISSLHDGELETPERQRVQAHLKQCAACRAELARLRKVSRILKTARRGTPSLWPRIEARLAAPRRARLAWVLAGASLALALLLLAPFGPGKGHTVDAAAVEIFLDYQLQMLEQGLVPELSAVWQLEEGDDSIIEYLNSPLPSQPEDEETGYTAEPLRLALAGQSDRHVSRLSEGRLRGNGFLTLSFHKYAV